ncbi:MAG TPA: LysE family translocator, partial [Acidiphilium sp.]|nr:LysE family translocator [Acidiphilium sp.]
MDLSAYLGFVVVSAAEVATPGPSTLFLVNNALSIGPRRALGVLSGDLVAIALLGVLSVVGLSAILEAHPTVFLALRLAGAGYVLWLGWGCLRSPSVLSTGRPGTQAAGKTDMQLWLHSFGVGVSNHKAFLFFTALFPQFIPVGSGRPVLLLFVLIVVIVKFAVLGSYALSAREVRRIFARPEHARRGRTLSGFVLLAFGGLEHHPIRKHPVKAAVLLFCWLLG